MRLIHVHGYYVEVRLEDIALARYVYTPDIALRESPKPYLHPVRTLAGDVVTAYRPHDHVWHNGIQVAVANLSGQNFWGGETYLRDRGYVQLDNNGVIAHLGWDKVDAGHERATLSERLVWRAAGGEPLLEERRVIEIGDVDPEARSWRLGVCCDLLNVAGRELKFASPTAEGREMAGYGGLFWRGPRSFTGGRVLADGGLEGEEAAMGATARWLAFVGRHDEVDRSSTLIFLDLADNRHPTSWFVRSTPFACAAFSFTFWEPLRLPAGKRLALRHEIVIVDGAWDRDILKQRLARARPYAGARA